MTTHNEGGTFPPSNAGDTFPDGNVRPQAQELDRSTAAHHAVMASRDLSKIRRYITDCPSDETVLRLAREQLDILNQRLKRLGDALPPPCDPPPSTFRRIYDEGGVVLLDDQDVQRHPDTVVIQAAGTWGPFPQRDEPPSDAQFTVVDRGSYWCIYGDTDPDGYESFEIHNLDDALYMCGLLQFGSAMTYKGLVVNYWALETSASDAHAMFNQYRMN